MPSLSPSPVPHQSDVGDGMILPKATQEGSQASFEKTLGLSSVDIMEELSLEGLETDKGRATWMEVCRELSYIEKHRAHNNAGICGVNFVSFVKTLRWLHPELKLAFEYEALKSVVEHAEDSAISPERKSSLARRMQKMKKIPLHNKYRGLEKIKTQITSAFARSSIDRITKGREMPSDLVGATVSSFPNLEVIPSFWMTTNRDALLYKLRGDERVLGDLYRDSYLGGGEVKFDSSLLSQKQVPNWQKAYYALLSLGGAIPETRANVLARFGNVYPIVVGPDKWASTESGWKVYSSGYGLRLPFGYFEHTRDYLETYQNRIEKGEIEAFTLEIRGRIDRNFIEWLSDEVFRGQDPIPNVELLYVVRLPSGKEYRMILKESSSCSQRPSQDPSSFSEEDREVIRQLGIHFLHPDNKRSLALVTDFRPEHYAADLQPYLSHPEKINELKIYREIRAAWDRSLITQILEAEKYYTDTVAVPAWQEPTLDNFEHFAAHCRERIKAIPKQQHFYRPEQFEVSDAQLERIMSSWVPKLFKIGNEERARIAKEALTNAHALRVEQGWLGPKEGYGMPLDHQIMDGIIHHKKRERYAKQQAKKLGIAPSAVIVPPDIGRPYATKLFFGRNELASKLELFRHDPRFKRQIYLRYVDPMATPRYQEYPIDAHSLFSNFVLETNFERLDDVLQRFRNELIVSATQKKLSQIQHTCLFTLDSLYEEVTTRIEGLRERRKTLGKEKKVASAALFKKLTDKELPKDEITPIVAKLHKQYEEELEKCERKLKKALEQAEFLFMAFFPSHFFKCGIRGHSIVDRQIVKLIYTIGEDSIARYAPEVPGKKMAFRPSHSQGLEGHNGYGVGESYIALHDFLFHRYQEWQAFDEEMKKRADDRSWYGLELNSSTGHYLVKSTTLPFSRGIIFSDFENAGVATDRCRVIDRLQPGLKVRGTGIYRF